MGAEAAPGGSNRVTPLLYVEVAGMRCFFIPGFNHRGQKFAATGAITYK